MLNVQSIRKTFGDKEVLRGISFSLQAGKIYGIIGPGGSGKSVLLKVLGGVYTPDAGSYELDNVRDDEISLMFQEGALFDSFDLYDNVAFPLVKGKVPSCRLPKGIQENIYPRICRILSQVGLSQAAHKFPGQLSGGMRKRASLARALVSNPRFVMLDDPTAGLDPVASSVIMDLIVKLHKEYFPTMIIVSHDLRRLFPVVDEVISIFEGRVSFQGSVAELLCGCNITLNRFVSCRYDMPGNPASP